jgi:hypothetical protein
VHMITHTPSSLFLSLSRLCVHSPATAGAAGASVVASGAAFADTVKGIMNGVYKTLRAEFDDGTPQSPDSVCPRMSLSLSLSVCVYMHKRVAACPSLWFV